MKLNKSSFNRIVSASLLGACLIGGIMMSSEAFAADKKDKKKDQPPAAQAAPTDAAGAEKVDVSAIKDKYWARGDENKLEVVQNRLYSKTHKLEVEPMFGIKFSDPFLDTRTAGIMLGYHFNEYFSLNAMYQKDFTVASGALTTFRLQTGGTTNINFPQNYYGVEAEGSLLYGKLSVIGKAIIYYDMQVMGGFGFTGTRGTATDGEKFDQNCFTTHVGLGQKFFLSKIMALRLDYRLYIYSEKLHDLNTPGAFGRDLGNRTNFTNSVMLGVSFFIGGDSKQ